MGFKNGVHAVKVAILPGSGRGHSEIVDHGDGVWVERGGWTKVCTTLMPNDLGQEGMLELAIQVVPTGQTIFVGKAAQLCDVPRATCEGLNQDG